MKVISIVQGSDEWKAHRANHLNASDAAAMMGVSKYKTRAQLLKEMATGIIEEVDLATQRRFAEGHRFEALARPLAEKIIGDDLSPVVGVLGKLSASFDGITFAADVTFEHKFLNNELRGIIGISDLPEEYCIQMEQQLHVSDAEKCLFMASKFDSDDNLVEEKHIWYFPDMALRARIIAGWAQFEIDLANYQHVEAAPEVIAAPVQDLPALSIQVNGSISLISNLQKFGARLNEFVATIDKEPSDDQGFADAEAAIKTLQNAQDALEAAEANALAQTSDIDDMRKTVKLYADTARTTRLMLEKMVKARKESIRIEIVSAAGIAFSAHVENLERETWPIQLHAPRPDFGGAIKGKKSIASLREAADTALRNGKIAADAHAADIRAKLVWCKESSAGYGFLFSDLQNVITINGMEAFQAIVLRRVDDHKAAEAAKQEAQRVAMQEAADRKAKAEADALIAAERAKIAAQEAQRVADAAKAQRMLEDLENETLAHQEAAIQRKDRIKAEDEAERLHLQAQMLRAEAKAKAEEHLAEQFAKTEIVDSQRSIREFLDSRDFKDRDTVRAILVEYEKFKQSMPKVVHAKKIIGE